MSRQQSESGLSFEDVVDLGSIPPGAGDVHRAPTAIADLPEGLLDEIKRAQLAEAQRTRIQPRFEMPHDTVPTFTDETPTRPGKVKIVGRPSAPDLHEALAADEGFAVAVAQVLPTPPPPPPPAVSFPPAMIPVYVETPRHATTRRLPLWLWAFTIVLLVAATIIGALAVHRLVRAHLAGQHATRGARM